jgi:hypothetical protein
MNFKNLISEDGTSVSLGRVSFWMVFALLIWFWIKAGLKIDVNVTIPDAPDSVLYSFYSLLLYNTGKKFTGIFNGKEKKIEVHD